MSKTDLRIIIVETERDRAAFNQAWQAIWIKEGYAKAAVTISKKYAKYNSSSVDYLLLNGADKAIGTLRIINQNKNGLPVLNDFSIYRVFDGREKICEATLLTVQKAERRSDNLATFLLLIELWSYVRTNNINGILIAADVRLWYMLKQKLGLCFTEIGKQKIYEGSLTVPGYLNVREQKERSKKTSPRNILEGAIIEI